MVGYMSGVLGVKRRFPSTCSIERCSVVVLRKRAIHTTNCRELLPQVSRSFAAVIRQLPKLLVTDIVVFYLVLRGLDTVEDDMTAFDDVQVKYRSNNTRESG